MKAWTYIDCHWVEGNPPVLGPMSHATWLSSIIFDGARAFEGVTPDLDRHCARALRSAETMGLKPMLSAGEIEEIAKEGVRKFPKGAELYIRPMFFAEGGWIDPDPATTRFMISVYESPLPKGGFSACVSQFRRPSPETAPTDAKASCLYPLAGRIMAEAKAKGFENGIVRDLNGNVAEFATANLFFVKDRVVHTPQLNGTFLPGVTRARIIDLLRKAGHPVEERAVKVKEVLEADEVFSSGNYAKVQPCTRVEDRHLQAGPVYKRARELYWEFAHKGG
ncbi:MAG: branched-chain amino acid aminotransferase [Alphaproteobacteria bacterium]|nr:branched-chain amino acid aminotransferase [Alphaproteobacteria bacterium]